MPTDAHRLRNKRYKETQDQIVVTVPRGARAGIKEHATNKGSSVNAYIIALLEQDIGCSMRDLADKMKSTQD